MISPAAIAVTSAATSSLGISCNVAPAASAAMKFEMPMMCDSGPAHCTTEPAFVALTAAFVAEVRGEDRLAFTDATGENARRLFRLP